jgi:N-glycosylase/DNA lyase
MKALIHQINNIPKEVHLDIDSRISEFNSVKNKRENHLFLELCFCLLTANYDSAKSIRIHEIVGNGFIEKDEIDLAKQLKTLGYRFPNMRAKYIVEARKHKSILYDVVYPKNKPIQSTYEYEHSIRMWLVANVKGIGMKEASHFLRNVGYNKLAIVDFHIMDVLVLHNLIEPYSSRSLTKNKYVEIEKVIHKLGRKLHMDMARLDYCLWYIETGKVLK